MNTRLKLLFEKGTRWEFWPLWVFYFPVFWYILFLAIRNRDFRFFATANPGIKNGGLLGDSKYATLKQLPKTVQPKTVVVPAGTTAEKIRGFFAQSGLEYPIIAKPDVGMRGRGVEKITDETALLAYFAEPQGAVLLQAYVDLPLEFGVFYIRYPGEKAGKVVSLMEREFLAVMGDGKQCLKELILAHERAHFYTDYLFERYADELDMVLAAGKTKRLGSIGNHCRGTKFVNRCDQITPELSANFDTLSQKIRGFFYGRYDVRAASLADLAAGKVQIIEVNGTNAEPAHIYDPQNSLWSAYKDVFWFWRQMADIARANEFR